MRLFSFERAIFFDLGTCTHKLSQWWISRSAERKHRQCWVRHGARWICLTATFAQWLFYYYKNSLFAEECHSFLLRVFGEDAPSRVTVGNWFREFSRGWLSIEDEPRPCHSETALTQENIGVVRKMIKEDPRLTFCDIKRTLNIGSTAAKTIVHNHLRLTKRFSC